MTSGPLTYINKKTRVKNTRFFVRLIGLEPTRIATPDPKSGASTNFATSARRHANQRSLIGYRGSSFA